MFDQYFAHRGNYHRKGKTLLLDRCYKTGFLHIHCFVGVGLYVRNFTDLYFTNVCVNCSRVTRLGEFSPIGRLFSFGSFRKITKAAQNVALLFTQAG
jgi:hypothetical protein